MSEFGRPAKVFYWVVVASACVIFVIYGKALGSPLDVSILLALVLLALANVFADLNHVHLNTKLEITLSAAIDFGAMLILGPAIVSIASAIGSVIGDVVLKKAWYKILFNASNTILSVFASGMAYQLMNNGNTIPLSSFGNSLAITVAGCVYMLVNIGVVNVMVASVKGYDPVSFIRSGYRGLVFQLITLIPLGTLLAMVYHQTPWGLILLLFPLLLTHYSFENYHKLLTESKQTIELLADAVDKRDRYTFQHSMRVAEYAEKVSRRMGMDLDDVDSIVFAARIHDLGKIGIPSSVLLKEAALTPDERLIIEQHPDIGARIISQLTTHDSVRELIAHHHERVDGKGYPSGLSCEQIPLGARILGVADAFEAMTSDRPYRKALSVDQAITELERGRGTQFDPEVVDHFLAVLNEEKQVRQAGIQMDLRAIKGEAEI